MDHVDGEVLVPFPGDHLIASSNNGVRSLGLDHTQILVRHGCGFFHISKTANEVTEVMQRDAGNRKVFHAPQGLHTVVGGVRQLTLAERVILLAPGGDHG